MERVYEACNNYGCLIGVMLGVLSMIITISVIILILWLAVG